MAERRKVTRKTKKTSPRRNTPKVKLSRRGVNFLCCLICLVCGGFLALCVYMNSSGTAPSLPQKTVKKAPEVRPQNNTQAEKKVPAAKPVPAVPEKQKIPESKKTQPLPAVKSVTETPSAAKKPSAVKNVSYKVPDNDKQDIPDPFGIPAAVNGATLVFVIDDAGRDAANVKRYTSLPMPLTIAVLPKLPQTKQCAKVIRDSGKEMILHQPMQAQNLNISPGPGAVTADMGTWEITRVIKENLAELGSGVKGLNNHEGSLITANEIKIGAVLDVCAEEGIYFLDSRTTAETKARQAALERDMTIYEKSGPYIDNVTTRSAELERIIESLNWANKHGKAVVIGHVDKSVNILPDLLNEMYPHMIKAGYKFATPSMLKK